MDTQFLATSNSPLLIVTFPLLPHIMTEPSPTVTTSPLPVFENRQYTIPTNCKIDTNKPNLNQPKKIKIKNSRKVIHDSKQFQNFRTPWYRSGMDSGIGLGCSPPPPT